MNTQRLSQIVRAATLAKRALDRRGSIRRNDLPKVSMTEQKWLREHRKGVERFTRCFDYADSEYVEDVDRMIQSRLPIVREIWVGARSLGCVGEEELPEGLSRSQAEHEDQAELTDMITLAYDDPLGFDKWAEAEVTKRLKALKRPVKNFVYRKAMMKLVMEDLPTDRDGNPVKCMITDDETGETRPIRIGDTITQFHRSTEPLRETLHSCVSFLDALYMEEPPDPRCEDDAMIRELTRDRINPNSDFEQDMLNNPDMVIPSEADELFENELYLRKVANHLTEKLIARNPKLADRFTELREEAYRRIRAAHGELVMDSEQGKLRSGRWLRPKDLFDDAEQRIRTLERFRARKQRVAPAPVDWSFIAHR